METAWSNKTMKVRKTRTLSENVSPLKIELDDKRGRYLQSAIMSPRLQPYSENIDVGSPLARYFAGSPLSGNVAPAGDAFTSPTFASGKYKSAKAQQFCGNSSGSNGFCSRGRLSLSPLSSIENLEISPLMSPTLYGTPVKVDEEVLVMDDILVRPMKSGRSSSSSSSGRGSSSSSASKSVFKTEICKAWEESGNSRYNSKCQFAHGKEEELHPSRVSMKPKPEFAHGKEEELHPSRVPMKGKPEFAHGKEEELHPSHVSMKCKPEAQKLTIRPGYVWSPSPNIRITHPDHTEAVFERVVTGFHEALPNWSPMDDGIEIVLPNGSDQPPSREEFDAYISSLVNGSGSITGNRRRFSAFTQVTEEESSSENSS